jgi:hypothetical protein
MLRRHRFDPIEREGELKIIGLLGPQRAVIVEHRDAFLSGNEIGAALRCYADHKVRNGFLDRAIVPGGQRVGLRQRAGIKRSNDADGAT